ncbi:MAG: sugar phosphate isomerase/epimerase [Lachnospiraceae bacterium]|nr:sugar phosphate isomerase/epimerase [Lachnospiraceae bacterium]
MRIGISSALKHDSPREWAEKMVSLGCRSVVFPVDYTEKDSVIADYADEARKNDLVIAEVGIWRNVFAVDKTEREEARQRALAQFRLADEIGADCVVNVAGTDGGPIWDGGYPGNYTKESWNAIVSYIQGLIDEVKPKRTSYSIEAMPWMYPTGPDEYLRMMKEVDREAFSCHLDVVNMINCPERYFFSDEFLEETFDKLGRYVQSCHLKDIRLREELTFQLEEVGCGEGTLNIGKYMLLAHKADPDMPMIIEHLNTDEEYIKSLAYVKNIMDENGII